MTIIGHTPWQWFFCAVQIMEGRGGRCKAFVGQAYLCLHRVGQVDVRSRGANRLQLRIYGVALRL